MAAVLIIRTRLIAAAMVLLAAFIVMGAGSLDAARARAPLNLTMLRWTLLRSMMLRRAF
ncbi:hypothetical protein [Pyruvatibacter mobilis]|uniref:hypothetical protein n=1 Tax=Pyruvatibacter mobilis TaxID=1712261 RepID=UPI003BAC4728